MDGVPDVYIRGLRAESEHMCQVDHGCPCYKYYVANTFHYIYVVVSGLCSDYIYSVAYIFLLWLSVTVS